MNLVAHQYLSFNDTSLQIGNLLAEVSRGKDYVLYPEYALGILLHRNIDWYTDNHSVIKQSAKLFYPEFKRFSPIIVDVMNDYFLIKNWENFSSVPFEEFKNNCYKLFGEHISVYPDKLKKYADYLIKEDWFARYGTFEGIEKTLYNLSKRSTFPIQMGKSITILEKEEKTLNNLFLAFFPDLIDFSKNYISSNRKRKEL